MENAERFRVVKEAVATPPDPLSWDTLASRLDLPDERWRAHDPESSIATLMSTWNRFTPDWDGVAALWLGVETDEGTYLDPVAFAELDATGFPSGFRWRGPPLLSAALTVFAWNCETGEGSEAYDNGASLAWSVLTARLLRLAPAGIPTLVGFGGGDWIVIPG